MPSSASLRAMLAASDRGRGSGARACPPLATPVAVPQGPNWTPATRLQFYSQDQGSQIMPLAWFEALKQPNGQPFWRRQPEPLRLPAQSRQPHARPAGRLHRQRLRQQHHGRHDLRRLPHPPDRLGRRSPTGSTAARRSSTSRASSPTSTPPSPRCWAATRPSRPLPTAVLGPSPPPAQQAALRLPSRPGSCASTR